MSIKTFEDDAGWRATFEDFTDKYSDISGFGSTPETAIEDLLNQSLSTAHGILQIIKPDQEYAEKLLSRAKEYIIESKNGFSCDVAEIQYRKPSIKYTYDVKKLNEYAEQHSEILAWRKTTEVKATAALKWLQ